MKLDDHVSGPLVVREPFIEHSELRGTKRPFVMRAIKCFVELYRVGRLLSLFACKSVLEVDQDAAPLSVMRSISTARLEAGRVALVTPAQSSPIFKPSRVMGMPI